MKCGNCGSTIPDNSIICRVCGEPVVSRLSDSDLIMCPYCGERNPRGVNICSNCGHTVEIPREKPHPEPKDQQQRPPRQNPSNKNAKGRKKRRPRYKPQFIIAVCFLLALIIGIIILIASVSKRVEPVTDVIQAFTSSDGKNVNFITGGKTIGSAEGSVASSAVSSDRNIKAVLTDNNMLYYVTKKSVVKVTDNAISFILSEDGSSIAYTMKNVDKDATATDESESETDKAETKTTADDDKSSSAAEVDPFSLLLNKTDNSLFLYDSEKGLSTLIANNVSDNSVALSSNGDTVAFSTASEDENSFKCSISTGGIVSDLGRNAIVAAVSDNAEYIYYLKFERYTDGDIIKLFAKHGSDEIKLAEFAALSELKIYTNRDMSEIIYGTNGIEGNFFSSKKAAAKKKLSNGFNFICPPDKNVTQCGLAAICPVDSFSTKFFTDSSSALYIMNSSFSPTLVSSEVKDVMTNKKGDKLFYLDGNEYLYKSSIKRLGKAEKLSDHAVRFTITPDGEKIYYINGDSELHCIMNDTDNLIAKKVYNSASSNNLRMSSDGTLYFLTDYSYGSGILSYCKNGKESIEIKDATDVHDVITDMSENIYYRSDYSAVTGTFDLYYGKNSKFKLIYEDIK
ncbi:MAG: zinc ribbon domain-containing protein [Clostridiales bacterium]|nr:zinc ribbon domain-containing protein [Clostridiales bacterium]